MTDVSLSNRSVIIDHVVVFSDPHGMVTISRASQVIGVESVNITDTELFGEFFSYFSPFFELKKASLHYKSCKSKF